MRLDEIPDELLQQNLCVFLGLSELRTLLGTCTSMSSMVSNGEKARAFGCELLNARKPLHSQLSHLTSPSRTTVAVQMWENRFQQRRIPIPSSTGITF
jgi:hypothetical protein